MGPLTRPLHAQGRKRIHRAIDLADALLERVEKIMRRNLTAPQLRDEARRRLADQFRTHAFPALSLLWQALSGLPLTPYFCCAGPCRACLEPTYDGNRLTRLA